MVFYNKITVHLEDLIFMNSVKIISLLFFCTLFSCVNVIKGQIGIVDREAKVKPTLLVLGSYHFANPGRDVVKSKVTDVSTPERQQQLEELVEKLKKFKPTKIVLECGTEKNAEFQDKFSKYLAGDYKISTNESEQIGFRLAKESAHKQIYCVDWNNYAPGNPSDYDYVQFAAKDKELDGFLKKAFEKLQNEGDKRDETFNKLGIIKQFIHLNTPSQIENGHSSYFDLIRVGRGKEYIGANWLSSWYGRNMKILANIIKITDSPQDRILAVYGAGHLKLLNQFANESEFYQVENPIKYLKAKN